MADDNTAQLHHETQAEWLGETNADTEQGQTDKDETADLPPEALLHAQ